MSTVLVDPYNRTIVADSAMSWGNLIIPTKKVFKWDLNHDQDNFSFLFGHTGKSSNSTIINAYVESRVIHSTLQLDSVHKVYAFISSLKDYINSHELKDDIDLSDSTLFFIYAPEDSSETHVWHVVQFSVHRIKDTLASGSGGKFALGAFYGGCNAYDAVRVACNLDKSSMEPAIEIKY